MKNLIIIRNKIISPDVIEKFFCCDLSICKGICCIEGVSGAPLNKAEAEILEEIYPVIKDKLPAKAVEVIEKEGTSTIDIDGDVVTPTICGKECVYVVFDENNIAYCLLQKEFAEQNIDFEKPISCHLYPIRTSKRNGFEKIIYEKWDYCSFAEKIGKKKNIRVFEFLEKPLIKKYGQDFYNELKIIANEYLESNK